MAMSRLQRLVTRFAPAAWAAAMEAESRAWLVRCRACGAERSIWELGGIRWKAKDTGVTATWGACAACGKRGWQTLHRREPGEPSSEGDR